MVLYDDTKKYLPFLRIRKPCACADDALDGVHRITSSFCNHREVVLVRGEENLLLQFGVDKLLVFFPLLCELLLEGADFHITVADERHLHCVGLLERSHLTEEAGEAAVE